MLLRCFLLTSVLFSVISVAQEQDNFIATNRASVAESSAIVDDSPVVRVAIAQVPMSFDPFANKQVFSQQFKHLLFDPLIRWNKDHSLENRLVKSWKRIDNRTIRFNLRPNILFHSGNKLTVDDVIWSFQYAKKQQNSNTYFLDKVESIKRISTTSFDIRSDLSNFQLLDYLTHVFVLDAKFYRLHPGFLESKPTILLPPIKELPLSGTGPYIISQYNPLLGIELKDNKNYWGEKPAIKAFRFILVNKPQSRLYTLLADDVQVSDALPNKSGYDLSGEHSKKLVKVPSYNAIILTINDKKSKVLHNENIRKALSLAINKEGMLKYIFNGSGRIDSSFIPMVDSKILANENHYKQSIVSGYNLEKSKELMKEAKSPKTLSLLVMLDIEGNTEQAAVALTHMLKNLDIKIKTKMVSSISEWDAQNLDFDLTISTWHTRLIHPQNVYEDLFFNSLLTAYIQDKFQKSSIATYDNFDQQFEFFKGLLQDSWVIPLLFQDEIWAERDIFNLEEIFSANGIPYWSLFKLNEKGLRLEADRVTNTNHNK